jgi:hypothetical protein
MANYCSTNDSLTYQQKWQGDNVTSPCKKYVAANMSPICNSSNYVPVVDAFVRQYFLIDGHKITYPQQGSTVFDPTMYDIISECQSAYGGCDVVLTQVCSGFTRSQLQSNPSAAALCGCFMADTEYLQYGGSFGIQKICDPMCVLESAVKPVSVPNNCTTQKCNQTICVIDNVTITLLNQSTAGNINFAQACSSCTGNTGGCICDISDISITAVQSSIKDINFSQNCGQTNCYKSDSQGVPQVVPCASTIPSGGGTTSPTGVSVGTVLIIIGIILFVILIIIIIVAVVANSKKKAAQQTSIYRPTESYGPAPAPALTTTGFL